MKRKSYETAEAEIIVLGNMDIVTTSGEELEDYETEPLCLGD